jgi:hypothetical protein
MNYLKYIAQFLYTSVLNMLAITLFNFPSLESCLLAGETQIKLVFTYVSNNCNQIFEHTTFFETNTYNTRWFVCLEPIRMVLYVCDCVRSY